MAYLKICEQTLGSQAEKAKRQANAGDPGPLELLRAVQDKTSSEVDTAHHIGAVMTTEELISAYSIDGIFPVRVAPRFGIWQGYKMVIKKDGLESHLKDEKGNTIRKLRCIDDFKVNGVNAQTMLADKLFLPNLELPARIGAEFFNKMGNDAPELILGLDDLFAAYRRVPNADSKRFGIVGIYNLDSSSVDWHEVLGLPFGLASAPVIFNRLPAAICAIARVYCGVAVDAFFDDFICVDRADTPITEKKISQAERPANAPGPAARNGHWTRSHPS